jgi:hypothetical protein
MISRPLPTRGQARLVCASVVLSALMCAGLLTAAALAPAPPVVLPLVIVVGIGLPMLSAWELRPSLIVLRAHRAAECAAGQARLLADWRRRLDALPETAHPLDR